MDAYNWKLKIAQFSLKYLYVSLNTLYKVKSTLMSNTEVPTSGNVILNCMQMIATLNVEENSFYYLYESENYCNDWLFSTKITRVIFNLG